jgi:hypothetical protein
MFTRAPKTSEYSPVVASSEGGQFKQTYLTGFPHPPGRPRSEDPQEWHNQGSASSTSSASSTVAELSWDESSATSNTSISSPPSPTPVQDLSKAPRGKCGDNEHGPACVWSQNLPSLDYRVRRSGKSRNPPIHQTRNLRRGNPQTLPPDTPPGPGSGIIAANSKKNPKSPPGTNEVLILDAIHPDEEQQKMPSTAPIVSANSADSISAISSLPRPDGSSGISVVVQAQKRRPALQR